MTLVDTSALIDYLLDGPVAPEVERLLTTHDAAASAMSAFELLAGVKSSRHRLQREELLSLTQVLPVTKDIAIRAAELYTRLRADGITVHNEGLVIAATAVSADMPVLTANARHFRRIPGLRLS